MKVKYASGATSSSDKERDKSDNKDRKEHLNKLFKKMPIILD